MNGKPFNPLDKKNLGLSVADALLEREAFRLEDIQKFDGAGVYAIYYAGNFPPYKRISAKNKNRKFDWPIYVGKAVPAGSRKGGYGLDEQPGNVLFKRLQEHLASVEDAENLDAKDFFCRYLVVDDIWIPLGESLLIEKFSPLWNKVVDGFGNHDPGAGRHQQQNSPWDILHPGRAWAAKLKESKKSRAKIEADVEAFLADR